MNWNHLALRMQGDTPFFRVGSCFSVSDVIQFRYELSILIILSRSSLPWPDSRVRKCSILARLHVFICVQEWFGAAFFGVDPVTGKNHDHRKIWIEDQLKLLSANFEIDLLAFAILSNHFHLILRSRPNVVETWDDSEDARTLQRQRISVDADSGLFGFVRRQRQTNPCGQDWLHPRGCRPDL